MLPTVPVLTLRCVSFSVMSDYEVEMLGDGKYEFEVQFAGPDDSTSLMCGGWASALGGSQSPC